jgi:S-adenosylmethionine hydrolase
MIVLCTDFGLEGPYAGQGKAVLARAAPAVPVIDLFADLPAFEPRPGDVILAVVDPGVGRARAALVVAAGTGLEVAGRRLGRARTFTDVPPGAPLWYANANGLAELALMAARPRPHSS